MPADYAAVVVEGRLGLSLGFKIRGKFVEDLSLFEVDLHESFPSLYLLLLVLECLVAVGKDLEGIGAFVERKYLVAKVDDLVPP